MPKSQSLSPVTPEHAKYFGFIINIFARIESQMMVCAAGILGTDLGTAHILMADTHYRQKRQTLIHLNVTLGIDGQVNQELLSILDELHKFSNLRNWVAHATWVTGNRPGTIKPMQLRLRGERPAELGYWHNEKGYTALELRAEANKLEKIARRFSGLLDKTGFWEKVQTKIDEIPSSMARFPGKPSSK